MLTTAADVKERKHSLICSSYCVFGFWKKKKKKQDATLQTL